jgi:Holliday junction resolvase RusA-like endonuclease
MKLKLKILGIPVPKQSVKFKNIIDKKTGEIIINEKTGKPIIMKYQPTELETHFKNVSIYIKSQLPANFKPFTGGVRVLYLGYVFPPLKSFSKKKLKKIDDGEIIYKTTKPDLIDNLNKGLFDAMEGIVYLNDSQVCEFDGKVRKYYGNRPKIIIELEEINGE